jgi:hypothetical protein
MFTFQEVFAARAAGLPVYQQTCEDGVLKWKFEQNDVFTIPLGDVRSHYRLQKISKAANGGLDIYFRLSCETQLKDDIVNRDLGLYHRIRSLTSPAELKPIAVRVNLLGEIND